MSDNLELTLTEAQSENLLNHGHLRREVFIMKPTSSSATNSNPSALLGKPGLYIVEFTLQHIAQSIPTEFRYDTQPDLRGSSLLKIGEQSKDEQGHLEVDSKHKEHESSTVENIKYLFSLNEDGFLSSIKTTLRASNFQTAESQSWDGLAPIISAWAFAHDIPLQIGRIRVEEASTGTHKSIHFNQPYKTVDFDISYWEGFTITRLYHPLVYYREALSATSPFYQFLCYYKVFELINGLKEKEEMTKHNIGNSKDLILLNGQIEEDDQLRKDLEGSPLYEQVVGKSTAHAIHTILKIPRNRVAHAFLDKDPNPHSRNAEDILNFEEVYLLLPLMKYIARQMVIRELKISL